MELLETYSLEVGLHVVQWTRLADNLICCRITLDPDGEWYTSFTGQAKCSPYEQFNLRFGMWLSLRRCIELHRLDEPMVYTYSHRRYIWQRFKQFVQAKGLYLNDKYGTGQKWKKIPEDKMPGNTFQYEGNRYLVKEIALQKGTRKDNKKWKKVVIYTCYNSNFLQTYVRDFNTFTSKYRPCNNPKHLHHEGK